VSKLPNVHAWLEDGEAQSHFYLNRFKKIAAVQGGITYVREVNLMKPALGKGEFSFEK
jgi:hypothetical protein